VADWYGAALTGEEITLNARGPRPKKVAMAPDSCVMPLLDTFVWKRNSAISFSGLCLLHCFHTAFSSYWNIYLAFGFNSLFC